MSESEDLMRKEVENILKALTREEREILNRVIAAERNKLHMKNPKGINEDIWKAIMEIIN